MQFMQLFSSIAFLAAAIVGQAQAQGTDWTGLYGGAQLDFTSIELSTPGTDTVTNDGNGLMAGLEGGYRYDFGNVVVGANVSLAFGRVEAAPIVGSLASNPRLNTLTTVGIEGGYDLGEVLIYGGLGYTWATMRDIADMRRVDSGVQIGIGADYLLSNELMIGGGLTRTILNGFNGSDVEATSFGIRAAFRF